ncbi:MAG TPA: PH domain-containing protein [Kribbella sp.]|nr:PH domain-containing protein [Kribbella sp.]
MQEKTYARFRTSLLRSVVVAPVASFLTYGFAPRQVSLDPYPVLTVIFDVMCVLFLVAAVRAWIVLLRGRSELRLTGEGLTIRRGRRELSLPWDSVGKVRVDWQSKTPWVVVWLHSSVAPEQVPVPRRSDGSYRVLPIGRGRSMKSRLRQLGEFRSAGMAYAGRYVDVTTPKPSG